MDQKKPLFLYFGHHKCATLWTIGILQSLCSLAGLKFNNVFGPSTFSYDLKKWLNQNPTDFLSFADSEYKYIAPIDNYRAFHVIRDPRDICVSAYFSHLNSHSTGSWPELSPHRNKLQKLSKEDGLLLDMEFTKYVLDNLDTWDYSNPNILELKMEALTESPYSSFLAIIRFLGLLDNSPYTPKKEILSLLSSLINRLNARNKRAFPFTAPVRGLTGSQILASVYKCRFSVISKGNIRGKEQQSNHYRKGTPGDWKNHFSENHIKYFKENHNDLLIKLGYENNPDWSPSI